MIEMSFFRKKSVCGKIRADQISKYLGAKLNPLNGYENDICIYVKRFPSGGREQYFDIVDAHRSLKHLKRRPDIGVIAISRIAENFLSNEFKNKVVFLPQHHCNFDRIQRPDREVKMAGWCGDKRSFSRYENEIREKLAKIGIDFIACYDFRTHARVMKFYNSIDVQIVWRKRANFNKMLKNPLKLSNAGSFGIPTVSMPEDSFVSEYDGCFVPANTIDEMVGRVEQLKKDQIFYKEIAEKCKERAEQYHISNVADYYRRLVK